MDAGNEASSAYNQRHFHYYLYLSFQYKIINNITFLDQELFGANLIWKNATIVYYLLKTVITNFGPMVYPTKSSVNDLFCGLSIRLL